MKYVAISVAIADAGKIQDCSQELGCSHEEMLGRLLMFWAKCGAGVAHTGIVTHLKPRDYARLIGFAPTQGEEVYRTFLDLHLIERVRYEGTVHTVIHDWLEWNGTYLKKALKADQYALVEAIHDAPSLEEPVGNPVGNAQGSTPPTFLPTNQATYQPSSQRAREDAAAESSSPRPLGKEGSPERALWILSQNLPEDRRPVGKNLKAACRAWAILSDTHPVEALSFFMQEFPEMRRRSDGQQWADLAAAITLELRPWWQTHLQENGWNPDTLVRMTCPHCKTPGVPRGVGDGDDPEERCVACRKLLAEEDEDDESE
jgi:hypothetical protein